MSSIHGKIVAIISVLGLLIYITLIESNVLSLSYSYRKIANIPAISIIAATGYYGLSKTNQSWAKILWLMVYVFGAVAIMGFGYFYYFKNSRELSNFRDFVNGLRTLLISPLPYLVIIYLIRVSLKINGNN